MNCGLAYPECNAMSNGKKCLNVDLKSLWHWKMSRRIALIRNTMKFSFNFYLFFLQPFLFGIGELICVFLNHLLGSFLFCSVFIAQFSQAFWNRHFFCETFIRLSFINSKNYAFHILGDTQMRFDSLFFLHFGHE